MIMNSSWLFMNNSITVHEFCSWTFFKIHHTVHELFMNDSWTENDTFHDFLNSEIIHEHTSSWT